MQAELVNIAELIPHPSNPKSHDIGAIVVSINTFGFMDRLVVNRRTQHILSGHGRVEALREMRRNFNDPPTGVEVIDEAWLVPVDYVDLPEEQESAALVSLNRLVELGGWDDHALATLLQEIAAQDTDLLAATGFDEDDLAEMLDNATPSSGSSAPSDPFGGFPNVDDGMIVFRFGDYAGRVSKEVYDSFKKEFVQQQTENDAVIMDDVLRAWLNV